MYFFNDSLPQELNNAAHKSFTLSLLVVSTACVTELTAASAEAGVRHNRGLFARRANEIKAEHKDRFVLTFYHFYTNQKVTEIQMKITLLPSLSVHFLVKHKKKKEGAQWHYAT